MAEPIPDFGHRCVDRLYEAKKAGLLAEDQRERMARIINEEFAMAQPALTLIPSTGKKDRPGSNIPPTPEEVEVYGRKIGWPVDGSAFCDFYERKNWKVGSVKMTNWQAALRHCKREGFSFGGPGPVTKSGGMKIDRTYERF